MITFNILSIISAFLTVPMLIFSAIAAHKEFDSYYSALDKNSRYAPVKDEMFQSQVRCELIQCFTRFIRILCRFD